jgi:hypothetical protein
MKKHFFYGTAIFIAFSIFSLTACEKIDNENISPTKLQSVESILKDKDFTNLMSIRNLISDKIINGSTKNKFKELSEIKNKEEYETWITEIGFKSLKEYNEMVFIEKYYLSRLQKSITNIDLLNKANKQYLDDKKNSELSKLKSARSACSDNNYCQIDYLNKRAYATFLRDVTVNNCYNSLPLNLQGCPYIYYPPREYCYQNWDPLNSNTIFYSCYTILAGYYQDEDCLNNAYTNYVNCINSALAVYNANMLTIKYFRNICLNNYGCPSRWDD